MPSASPQPPSSVGSRHREVDPSREAEHVPGVVAPSTRVNVALPFSHFKVEEPSRELVELAQVVARLAAVVEEAAPGPQARLARRQADALARRLR